MPNNTCQTCGASFPFPWKLKRHLARKTPCAPILEQEELPGETLKDPDLDKKTCRFCNRMFSSYPSMRRHVRTACKIAPNKKNGDAGMELLYEHTLKKQQERIDFLEAQNAEMMGMMRQILAGQQNGDKRAGEIGIQGNNNSVGNTINNHQTFNISVFGSESLEHVDSATVKAILDDSRKLPEITHAAETALLKTAMLIYSDPDHPENLTCYLPNKKGDETLVHTDGGWEIRPTRLVLSPMASTTLMRISDKQPYERAEDYGEIMAELVHNEKRYIGGQELRPILVRNKDLLRRALETLPVAGDE